MARSPEGLKAALGSGLLSFPVTNFTNDGAFAPGPYQAHVDYLVGHRPAAVFAAGGTGEFFSLRPDEYESVIAAAVESAGGRLPVVAGVGYGTALAIEFARRAGNAGADGILLLPQYLIQAEQEGLYCHIAAICRAVEIGVVVYYRYNCLFELDTMRRLADQCPNLIGFKDRPWRYRAADVPSRDPGRPAGLHWRDAHSRDFCRCQSSDRRLNLFIRDLQFRSRVRAALLRGDSFRRPCVHAPGVAQLLHSVSRAQEPASRLRGQHRQGGLKSRRPTCRPGARASARSHRGSRSDAGRTCDMRDENPCAAGDPGARGGMKQAT
jgi:hypothetical protein